MKKRTIQKPTGRCSLHHMYDVIHTHTYKRETHTVRKGDTRYNNKAPYILLYKIDTSQNLESK